jgi:hypothetical protein
MRLHWPFAEEGFASQPSESQQSKEANVLKVLLVCCMAAGVSLGTFALAGDRLGLWKPAQAPRASTLVDAGWTSSPPTGVAESATGNPSVFLDQAAPHPPSPPLRARTAFLLAAFAGVIGLVGWAAREHRIVYDARRGLSARVARVLPRVERANRARSQAGLPRPRGARRPPNAVPALAVRARTVFRAPRHALVFATAVATRARRPRLRPPSSVVAFHLTVHRHREEVTFSMLAVAVGVGLGYLAVVLVG